MATSVGSVVFSLSADIKDIQAQLRNMEGQFAASANKITQSFRTIGTSLGQVFAAGAITAYINKVVDLGDQLSDLADRTGLSVAQLGGLRAVAAENGTTLEAFAAGIVKAQRSMGEMTDEGNDVAVALRAMGLNVEELKRSSPDQFLEAFAKGLANVEDRNQRAAIAARVFGKSAAELLPTLLTIAEKGLPQLSDQTADAYRRLGEFKDQMAVVSAEMTDNLAPAIAHIMDLFARLLGVSSGRLDLQTINSQIAALNKIADRELKKLPADAQASFNTPNPKSTPELDAIFKQIADLEKRKAEIEGSLANKPTSKNQLLNLSKPSTPGGAAGVDKLKSNIEAYTNALQGAIAKEEEQRIKLQFGEITALKAAQAFDTLALKEKLLADGLKIPPNVGKEIADATAFLTSLGVNVAQLSSTDFPKLREEYLKLADSNAQVAEAVKALDAAYSVSNESLAKQTELTREQAAQQARLRQEFAELVQQNQVGAIKDPENRRIAGIEVDFAKTAARIQELGNATGQSQEAIAAAIADAWKKALNEIDNTVDESTQFQIEALRNIQDAVGSFINDALNGNLKGWQSWADGVRKAINSVISQLLASQINEFLLGSKSQTSQGQVGGLLGNLGGSITSLFGGSSGPVQLSGPTDTGASSSIFSSLFSLFGYANGGRPPTGIPSIVGERGPELFIPDTAGTIVPNGRFGGTTINMNISTPDAASFQRSEHAIAARMGGALSRASRR